jgi:hypothetical protein
MLLQDFSARAEEYLRLAERAGSTQDREFFLEMARAWYGMKEEGAEVGSRQKPPTRH